MEGVLHPVVFGKEIGSLSKDRMAKYAKACDSIKSPFILKSSIFLSFNDDPKFF